MIASLRAELREIRRFAHAYREPIGRIVEVVIKMPLELAALAASVAMVAAVSIGFGA